MCVVFRFLFPFTSLASVLPPYSNTCQPQALPARQIQMLSGSPAKKPRQESPVANTAVTTTVRSIDAPFLYSTTKELKEQRERAAV